MFFIVPLITFRVISVINIFIKKRFPFGGTSCVSDNRFGHLEIPRTMKPSIEFYLEKTCTTDISERKLIDSKRITKLIIKLIFVD